MIYSINLDIYLNDCTTEQKNIINNIFQKYIEILNQDLDISISKIFEIFNTFHQSNIFITFCDNCSQGHYIYHILISYYLHKMRNLIFIMTDDDIQKTKNIYDFIYNKLDNPNYYETKIKNFLHDLVFYVNMNTFNDYLNEINNINNIFIDFIFYQYINQYDIFYYDEIYSIFIFILNKLHTRLSLVQLNDLFNIHSICNPQNIAEYYLFGFIYFFIIQKTMYLDDESFIRHYYNIHQSTYNYENLGYLKNHYFTICKMKYIILCMDYGQCKKFLKTLYLFQKIKAKHKINVVISQQDIFDEMSILNFADFEILIYLLVKRMLHFKQI